MDFGIEVEKDKKVGEVIDGIMRQSKTKRRKSKPKFRFSDSRNKEDESYGSMQMSLKCLMMVMISKKVLLRALDD